MNAANIFDVTIENFPQEVLERSSAVPVMVDFWAQWCNPCHMLAPVLTRVVQSLNGAVVLAKVNTDEQQSLAVQFGVRSLPTVKLFRDGGVVDEFSGALPEAQVREFLAPHLDSGGDQSLEQARALARAGAVEQALAMAAEAHAAEPENDRLSVGYAELLMLAGRTEEAETLLRGLPANVQETDDVKRLLAAADFSRMAAQAPPLAQLQARLEADPQDSEAHCQAAAHEVLRGNYAAAMEHLFTVFQRDRRYGDDAARKHLLAVFTVAGDHAAVAEYRRRMSALLY